MLDFGPISDNILEEEKEEKKQEDLPGLNCLVANDNDF